MAATKPLDLPATADRPAIQPAPKRRPFGVRLWLALMFAAIGILTGSTVYLFVAETSQQAAEDRASEVAQGQSLQLASELGATKIKNAGKVIAQYRNDAFAAWYFNRRNLLKTQRDIAIASQTLASVPNQREARRTALSGQPYATELEGGLTVVGQPVFRNDHLGGALLVQADRPAEVFDALADPALPAAHGAGDRCGRRRDHRLPRRQPDHLAGQAACRRRPPHRRRRSEPAVARARTR